MAPVSIAEANAVLLAMGLFLLGVTFLAVIIYYLSDFDFRPKWQREADSFASVIPTGDAWS